MSASSRRTLTRRQYGRLYSLAIVSHDRTSRYLRRKDPYDFAVVAVLYISK
jgi:hypothetical protein